MTTTILRRDEDLRVGDVMRFLSPYPWVTITAIRPYTGPLSDIIFAIAETVPGCGISLERGGQSEVAERGWEAA